MGGIKSTSGIMTKLNTSPMMQSYQEDNPPFEEIIESDNNNSPDLKQQLNQIQSGLGLAISADDKPELISPIATNETELKIKKITPNLSSIQTDAVAVDPNKNAAALKELIKGNDAIKMWNELSLTVRDSYLPEANTSGEENDFEFVERALATLDTDDFVEVAPTPEKNLNDSYVPPPAMLPTLQKSTRPTSIWSPEPTFSILEQPQPPVLYSQKVKG